MYFDKITTFSNLDFFQVMANTGGQACIINLSYSVLAMNLKLCIIFADTLKMYP